MRSSTKLLSNYVVEGFGSEEQTGLNAMMLMHKKKDERSHAQPSMEDIVAHSPIGSDSLLSQASAAAALIGSQNDAFATDSFFSETNTAFAPPTAIEDDAVAPHVEPPRWFVKSTVNPFTELMTNECYRLYIPGQPKTRAIQPDVGGPVFIASKDVGPHVALADIPPQTLCQNIADGEFYGLGFISVVALLLNEIDMHMKNVVVAGFGTSAGPWQIIKLDGDWVFGSLLKNYQMDRANQEITATVLNELPLARAYHPINWLDNVIKSKFIDSPFMRAIQGSRHFRREVNIALLRCLLVPAEFIKDFFTHYAGDDEPLLQPALNEFQVRWVQLRDAALHYAYFTDYIVTELVYQDLDAYWNELETFHLSRKATLVSFESISYEKMLYGIYRLRQDLQRIIFASPTLSPIPIVSRSTNFDQLCHKIPMLTLHKRGVKNKFFHATLTRLIEDLTTLVTMRVLSDVQIDILINLAHDTELACFEEMYVLLSDSIHPSKMVPLGFYKTIAQAIKEFFSAQTLDDAAVGAQVVEALLQRHKHMFMKKEHSGLNMKTAIGLSIDWLEISGLKASLQNVNVIQRFQAYSRDNLTIEKLLFRFGFSDSNTSILAQASLREISELFREGIFFGMDLAAPLPNEKARYAPVQLSLFTKLIKVKYHLAEPFNFNQPLSVAIIESYIEQHREALTCSDHVDAQATELLRLVETLASLNRPEAQRFLKAFFCDPAYPYGMFSLVNLRASLFKFDSRKLAMTPLLTLLYWSMPAYLSFNEMLIATAFHFATPSIPVEVMLRGLGFEGALVDHVAEVIAAAYYHPKIPLQLKDQFLLEILKTHDGKGCRLPFEKVMRLYCLLIKSVDKALVNAHRNILSVLQHSFPEDVYNIPIDKRTWYSSILSCAKDCIEDNILHIEIEQMIHSINLPDRLTGYASCCFFAGAQTYVKAGTYADAGTCVSVGAYVDAGAGANKGSLEDRVDVQHVITHYESHLSGKESGGRLRSDERVSTLR